LLRLVGSVDIIGNPVGLFYSISTGVEDFFYEPYQGFARGPKDFARGLGVGSVSLVQNFGYGVLNTTSKITGSVSKGFAQVTMDEQYLAERDASKFANRNKSVAGGTLAGAQSVVHGFTTGITGIFSKPIEGARESGVTGFLTGTAKGVVGAVAKPVVGILDGATQVVVGLRNQTKSSSDHVERERLPRHIGPDHIIRPYDPIKAAGSLWLQTVNAGQYFDYQYIMHVKTNVVSHVVLVTDRAVIAISSEKNKLLWIIPYEMLADVKLSGAGGEAVSFYQYTGHHNDVVKAHEVFLDKENDRQELMSAVQKALETFKQETFGLCIPPNK